MISYSIFTDFISSLFYFSFILFNNRELYDYVTWGDIISLEDSRKFQYDDIRSMAIIYPSCINSIVKVYIFIEKYKHVLNYYISVCTDATILCTCFMLFCTVLWL